MQWQQRVAAGIQKKIPRAADAAAEDNDLRRKNRIQRYDTDADFPYIAGKNALGVSVTALSAVNQLYRFFSVCHPTQRSGRSVFFIAAALSAGAGQPIGVGDSVTQLGRKTGGAEPALTVQHNTAADARAQRQ